MDCGRVDYGDDEAASIPPASVIISSSNAELKDELHISRKVDDVDDVDDVDRQSEGSGVMESSVSDDTSLPTDGSTDTAEPCGRGV